MKQANRRPGTVYLNDERGTSVRVHAHSSPSSLCNNVPGSANVIREAGAASLVFVCGAAGVRKTAVKNHVTRYALAGMLQASRQDRERVHILSLLARSPINGSSLKREFL